MKQVKLRSMLLAALVAVLAAGVVLFCVRYVVQGGQWAAFSANDHAYRNGRLALGQVLDRNGVLLYDGASGSWAEDGVIRRATLHVVGDRDDNISTSAKAAMRRRLVVFDPLTGTSAGGHKVYLTIDAELNAAALEALNGRKGAVAVYNYRTGDVLCISAKGRPVKPKTIGQKEYIRSVLKNTVTIGVGPAGTGKTYLAVAAAVQAFRDKQVNRIILTRPAVEAGERLGFLPGDLQSKVDPYLRPLYDALFDMLGAETYQKYLERGNIEVAPLAYMRGRTLDDSFIILDEAQNTSREQMKMFLTRLGFGSKIVITGDVTQIDLPDGKASGLKEAMRVLRDVEGIGICELTNADVVRHVMVQRIVEAYERYETAKNGGKGRK